MPIANAAAAAHKTYPSIDASPHRWALSPWARAFRRVGRRWIVTRHIRDLCPDMQVSGAEHMSSLTGPALIIANHTSHVDTLIVLSVLPHRLYDTTAVAAAADRFYTRRLKGAWFSLRYNSFPIVRGGGRAALDYCDRLLDRGHAILIFPEGTRSRTGELLPFHPGPAILAVRHGLPVLPVYIQGAADILPPGAPRARPARVSVRIGPPQRIDTDDVREATGQMERAMCDLAAATGMTTRSAA